MKKEEKKYCELPWEELRRLYNIPSYDAMTEGWFSLRRPLSYNRYFMTITGKRSTGKSTNTSLYILLDYLIRGKGWVYTRRTKDESELTGPTWFNNAVGIINRYITKEEHRVVVEYKGGKYFVNGKLAGYMIPLSLQQKVKSADFSTCDWIVYDEFIVFEGGSYLGGANNPIKEYRALMSLRETVDRAIDRPHRNEVKIICLGNNESLFNPVYMGLGADRFIRMDTHYLAPKGEEWVCVQLNPDDATKAEDYKESIGYKLADQRTREYAYENKSKEESASKVFVKKLTHTMRELCNLHFDGFNMILCADFRQGYVYVKSGYRQGLDDYALTFEDHRPNYMLTLTGGSEGYLATLKTFYNSGNVWFENMRCKYCIDNFYKYVI